ncbi:MAG: glycerate kinase, partial [Myxococcales bacterium]|nr:glycerate kinase [Myxococcales bacterium]
GGLPVALAALGAELRPGFAALAERVGLDAALDAADLVLTGEGRVDEQTPRGKTVGGLLARTAARQRPTWIFGGEITPEAEVWCPPHGALVPIADGPRPREWLMANAPTLLTRAAARAARLWALCAQ